MRPIDVIHLTRRDTINTACALLQSARSGAQVWMVVPWRAHYLRSLLNLKRLKRVALDGALDLRLVSTHSETRSLALAADIPVAYWLPGSLRRHRPRETRSTDLGRRVLPTEEKLSARYQKPPRYQFGRYLLSLVFVGLLLAMLGGVVVFFTPEAQVTLEPVSTRQDVMFTARANARYREIDDEQALMPLRGVQVVVEASGSTPATGSADVPEGYASGEVVFTNRTNEALAIPQGTVVRATSGVTTRFRTTVDANLAPNEMATVRVPVSAADAGYVMAGAYTLNRVDGVLASKVEVINDTSIGGGTSRRVPTVAPADLDTLHAVLASSLQQQAYDQLISQLEPGEFIPSNSIRVEVMSMDYDQVIYQQVDALSGVMKLAVSGSAINDVLIRDLARARLVAQAGGNVDVIEDSIHLARADDGRVADTWVEIDVQASGDVVPTVDMAFVREHIRGRLLPEATAWLESNLELASPPLITISPPGWGRLPFLAGRLNVALSSLP